MSIPIPPGPPQSVCRSSAQPREPATKTHPTEPSALRRRAAERLRRYQSSLVGSAVFLLATAAIFTPLHAQDRDDPATELASFTLADGFEASLFASEVDGVVKPIQMRFDARGRLWVIGSSVYPQIAPGQEANDKVLILEDTDGDGRCDKSTVFADGLMIPTGLETLADGSGCYVGHGTELLLLRDTDGDSRADQREVVLRGFGTGDNHQNINSFAWGPSGELWFCQGLHAHARVETPFGIVKLDQAGIWRLNTRTLRLEGFYGSAADPQNPWGFVFTDWGEAIELAGNNSVLIYPTPGMVKHTKPAQPANIWPTDRGRKMSGGEIVGTTHFPDHWQGRLIVGGYLNNGVWTMNIHDDGAGFRLEDAEPLVTSPHSSFRPVDVKFGPDGALYLCDWYNPIIGHYQASFRHPDRDRNHGRIWRVTAKGRPLTPKPSLVEQSTKVLLRNLGSSDRWTRAFSRRLLAGRAPDAVESDMRSGALASLADVDRTAEASVLAVPIADHRQATQELGLLADLGRLSDTWLARSMGTTDPNVQAVVAAVLGRHNDLLPANAISTRLRTLAQSDHPRVRLHAIVACTYLDTPEAVEIAMTAGDQPTDPFLDFALDQAVFSLKPRWLPALREGRLVFDHNPGRLARFIRADGTSDTTDALRTLLHSPALDPASRESFLAILAETGDAADLAAIVNLEDQALQSRLLPAVTRAAQVRSLRPPGDLTAIVRSLLASSSPAIQDEALRLVGVWQLEALKPQLLERATTAPGALAGLLALDPDAAARIAAAELARDIPHDRAVMLLPPFFQRTRAADRLVKAMAALPPSSPTATTALRVLSERGLTYPALSEALSKAAGPAAAGWAWSQEFANALATEVLASGDPVRGPDIFRRAELTCTACHSIGGEGGRIGPALDAVGAAQPIDFLVGAVLAPQKEVKEGFEAVQATTKTGEIIVGYRAPGPPQDLSLRDPATGSVHRLPRPTLAEEKVLGSLMPSGLINTLTREDLRDLFKYLGTLGKSAAPTTKH